MARRKTEAQAKRMGVADLEIDHPDSWGAGLRYSGKTLNINEVGRAKDCRGVLTVCLQHNLRQDNEEHRHRYPIDATRTPLNEVLRGPARVDEAVQLAMNNLESVGIVVKRKDAIMGIEIVVQPGPGVDLHTFWALSLQWIGRRGGYILSAVVHHDQKRPHMHVIVQPIVDGKLVGAKLTKGRNRFVFQRREFLAYMRQELGLRPDRPYENAVTRLMISPGRGPRRHEEAQRRDAKLVLDVEAQRRLEQPHASLGVLAHVPAEVHAQSSIAPKSLLRSGSAPSSEVSKALVTTPLSHAPQSTPCHVHSLQPRTPGPRASRRSRRRRVEGQTRSRRPTRPQRPVIWRLATMQPASWRADMRRHARHTPSTAMSIDDTAARDCPHHVEPATQACSKKAV